MIHVFQISGALTSEVTESLTVQLAEVLGGISKSVNHDSAASRRVDGRWAGYAPTGEGTAEGKSHSGDALVFHINSPGGEIAGVKELATMIADAPLPTLAVVGDVCASAAYWLASQCDQIWAISPLARIGSVGGMVHFHKPSPALAEWFGEEVTVYAPQSTAKNAEIEALRTGDTEPLRRNVLEPLTAVFIADVFRGRAGRLVDAQDASLSSGVALYASEALGRGWIDKVVGTRLALRGELATFVLAPDGRGVDERGGNEADRDDAQRNTPSPVTDPEPTPEPTPDPGTRPPDVIIPTPTPQPSEPMPGAGRPAGGNCDERLMADGSRSVRTEEDFVRATRSAPVPEGQSDMPLRTSDAAVSPTATDAQNATVVIPPVSGVGALAPAESDLLLFAEQHADDPLAIVARLREEVGRPTGR